MSEFVNFAQQTFHAVLEYYRAHPERLMGSIGHAHAGWLAAQLSHGVASVVGWLGHRVAAGERKAVSRVLALAMATRLLSQGAAFLLAVGIVILSGVHILLHGFST